MGLIDSMFPGSQNDSAPSLSGQDNNADLSSPRNQTETNDILVKAMRYIRLVTAVAGIAMFACMLFSILYYVFTFSLTCIIISIYLTPIGCVIFVVEWRKFFYEKVIYQLPFLRTTLGRSLLYIFVAGQCLALESTWGYIFGAYFVTVGGIGAFFYCTKEHGKAPQEAHTQLPDVEAPQTNAQPYPSQTAFAAPVEPPVYKPEPGSKSLADDSTFGSSVGAAVGAAALDWASRNPEQAQQAASYAFNAARENPEMVQSLSGSTSADGKATV